MTQAMPYDQDDIQAAVKNADCLFTEVQVSAAITSMAQAINRDYLKRNPILLCVMNGGLVLSGQLLPRLSFPLQIGYVHATRYGNATQGGQLHWPVPVSDTVRNRHVIIADDILDEGHTLLGIIDACQRKGAAHVATAVLVNKQHSRKAHPDLHADYLGLDAPDRYLFGYGMDYKGYWRNAPGIYAL